MTTEQKNAVEAFLEYSDVERTKQNLRYLLLHYIQSDNGDLSDMAVDLGNLFDLLDEL